MRVAPPKVLLVILVACAACEGLVDLSVPGRASPQPKAPAPATAQPVAPPVLPSGDGVDPVPDPGSTEDPPAEPEDPPPPAPATSGCQHQCATDQGRCSDGSIQRCVLDANGCLVWDAPAACGAAQLCVDGVCAIDPQVAYVDKLADTPDYCQTDTAFGGFAGGGAQYCAPVSFSNGLIWLDSHGFTNLVVNSADPKRDQFDLATTLGSSDYMNTDLSTGTSPSQAMDGLKRYLGATNYAYKRIQYQGWRWVAAEYRTGVETASLDWIKRGVVGSSFAWVNIGWYDHDAATDQYLRKGGHWATVVGFGSDGTSTNANFLVLHDSLSCSEAKAEYAAVAQLPSGTLTGANAALPRSAIGQLKITRGIAVPSYAQIALIDGAVVLEL